MEMSESVTNREQSISIRSFIRIVLVLITGAVVVAATTTISLAVYLVNRISKPRRSRRPPHFTLTPWEFQIPYDTVQIPVGDDTISGWFLPQKRADAPCILGLSGFGSHKAELLGIATNLYRDGFAVLLIDYRGAGRSYGEMVTMGHLETEDARAAIDWIQQTVPDAPIGVIGFSMGGSIALMVTATDDRVKAVVSDSAFATQRSVLSHQIRVKTRLWPAPILAAAAPMLRRRHQRSYEDFAPADMVHHIAPRPLMLIHARDDKTVPIADGMTIRENAQESAEVWFLDEAGHCGAYFKDRDAYCRRVSDFLTRAL